MNKYDFFDKIQHIDNSRQWHIVNGENIYLESTNGLYSAEEGSKTLFISALLGNTKLPVHHLAFSGLQIRAGFKQAEFFDSPAVSIIDKVDALNTGLHYCNPEKAVTCLERENYYLAFHSSKYIPVKQSDIYNLSDEILGKLEGEFIEGEYTLEQTVAQYQIKGKSILDTISNRLNRYGVKNTSIALSLFIVTSDVAVSGINAYPRCTVNGMDLPLCKTVKAPHLGENPLDKVIEGLNNLVPSIQISIEKMGKLQSIELDYPLDVANKLVKKMQLPKKIRKELNTELIAEFSGITATAFDVYLTICNILSCIDNLIEKCVIENKIANVLDMSISEWNSLDK